MLPIDEYMIKRVDKGDIIVRGNPLEISKKHFEEGWYVVGNLRDLDELEVEKSSIIGSQSPGIQVRIKLPYAGFIDNDWYILEGLDLNR